MSVIWEQADGTGKLCLQASVRWGRKALCVSYSTQADGVILTVCRRAGKHRAAGSKLGPVLMCNSL